MDADLLAEIEGRLADAGRVRSRRMFGGAGLYLDGVFCALLADDRLYFRVDDESLPEYEAAGSTPFQPFEDKPSMRTYWEVPERVQSDRRLLKAWALRALAAARDRDAGKPRRASSARGGGGPAGKGRRAEKIPNLGPVSMRWLARIGVRTLEDLRRMGSVAAYRALRAQGVEPTLNFLYAAEAALLGLRWNLLPEAVKANLRARAGVAPPDRARSRRGSRA